jgi:hypothetical protein
VWLHLCLTPLLSGELQHKAYVSAADVDKYKHRLETVDTHYVEGRSS